MRILFASLLLMTLAALSGCGSGLTFTFKPGMGPDRMEGDEKECGGLEGNEAAFVECMRAKGWYVKPNIGAAETPTVVAAARVAATPAPVAAPVAVAPAAAVPAVVASEPPKAVPTASPTRTPEAAVAVPAPPVSVTPDMPPAPPPEEVRPESPGMFSISGTPKPIPAAEVPASAVPAGSESLPRVRVSSWWKLGGSAAGLDASVSVCVERLGPPHRPDPGVIFVTVAMKDCLKSEGWYAYGEAPVQ